jgi:hypothetical protein
MAKPGEPLPKYDDELNAAVSAAAQGIKQKNGNPPSLDDPSIKGHLQNMFLRLYIDKANTSLSQSDTDDIYNKVMGDFSDRLIQAEKDRNVTLPPVAKVTRRITFITWTARKARPRRWLTMSGRSSGTTRAAICTPHHPATLDHQVTLDLQVTLAPSRSCPPPIKGSRICEPPITCQRTRTSISTSLQIRAPGSPPASTA